MFLVRGRVEGRFEVSTMSDLFGSLLKSWNDMFDWLYRFVLEGWSLVCIGGSD